MLEQKEVQQVQESKKVLQLRSYKSVERGR